MSSVFGVIVDAVQEWRDGQLADANPMNSHEHREPTAITTNLPAILITPLQSNQLIYSKTAETLTISADYTYIPNL